jgi:hypothetical protein
VKGYIYRGRRPPKAGSRRGGSRGGGTQERRHMRWRTTVNLNGMHPYNPSGPAPGEASQGEAAPRGGGTRGGAPP